MAAAIQEDVVEHIEGVQQLQELTKLNETDKMKLLELIKEKKCLWSCDIKATKEEKQVAMSELEEAFGFTYTSGELMAAWKSLRTSMLREVKKQKKDKSDNVTWKFYQAILFLKPTLEKAIIKSDEWPEEDKRSLINYFSQHHELWNHRLADYHDKARRQVLLSKLKEELANKYSEKDMVATWGNLKTYFDRERMREKGSKTTGKGTSQVYTSAWKFYQDMSFVVDENTDPDTPRSTLDLSGSSPGSGVSEDATSSSQYKRKRKMAADDSIAKRNLMYDTAIQFMQQQIPASPQPQPVAKSDEDLFGQYVAGQLKLIADTRSKVLIKAKINNLFLMHQLEQQSPAPAPFTQSSQLHNQDFGMTYY